MEIWRILLIILVIVLLLALFYSFVYTLKSRIIADYQAFEKPPRVIDQTQNSYSIMPSQYIKRSSNIQKDFIDSFIDLSKDPSSSTALASTSILPDKPRVREEGEGLPRSDRSIDFLLATTTTRRGYSKRGHNPEHTHLEVNRLKMKKDLEKAQYDIREDISKIEKEVAAISGIQLFKAHIWKSFLHYHYLIALFFRYQRVKPVRHHILYNSSLYLIVLYIMSFLASELGPNSLKNSSLIAIGCLILTVMLLLVVYSLENTEDECLAADLMPEQRIGEEQIDERTNTLLMISQKRFIKEIISKFICILGLAGGIAMFSRISKLAPEVTEPLFGGFMVVVVLDIAVVRNLVIVVLTGSLGSVIRKKIVKEKVRELAEKRASQPSSILYGNEANKKLFTIQQDARENYASNHYSEIKDIRRLWSKDRINLDTNSNEPEETDDRRQRLMSFSDKDRPEIRSNTLPSEAHVEDTTSRHRDSPPKEGLKNVNSSFSSSSTKNIFTPTSQLISKPPAAKFSIFIPLNRLGVGMVDEDLNQKKISEDSAIRASIEEHIHARNNTVEDDKISNKRLQYSQTLSKGLDTGKLFREDEESKEDAQENYTHQTHHTQMEPENEDGHMRFNYEEQQQEVPEEIIEEIAEEEGQTKRAEYREGEFRAEKLFGELEAEMDESIEKKRTQKVEEPEPLPPAKEVEQSSENRESEPTNHVTLASQVETIIPKEIPIPKDAIKESLKQASIASAKKALANFKQDWFESLSSERKDEVVIPNPVVEAEMKKEESRKETPIQPVFVKENNIYGSDTSLSLPNSLAYLDQDKSSVNQLGSQNEIERSKTLKKLISRKESILSQEEFRYEVENFVKNFPKHTAKRNRNNISDSENEGELSKHEINSSIQEYDYKRQTSKKEPLRENRFALQERVDNRQSPKHMMAEAESYPELQDDFVKGTEWLGYDAQIGKKKQRPDKQFPSYEERKSKMMQEEMEKNKKKKAGTHSKGFLMPTFNLDKLSEVSKSYGFKIQPKGVGTSNQDLIISRLEQKRKSASVDKPDEELLENRKLPRVTKSSVRSHRRISVEDKREVKSLNKLASLPEIKEVTYKHY